MLHNHKSETHTMKRNIQIFDDKIFSSLHTFKPKKKKDIDYCRVQRLAITKYPSNLLLVYRWLEKIGLDKSYFLSLCPLERISWFLCVRSSMYALSFSLVHYGEWSIALLHFFFILPNGGYCVHWMHAAVLFSNMGLSIGHWIDVIVLGMWQAI